MNRKQLLCITAVSCLFLSGCGDSNVFSSLSDDSTESAKVEQGLDALNSGNYTQAITTFEAAYAKNPSNPELAKYLASAYVGNTGFDVLDLVNRLSEEDESGSSDDDDALETIGDLYGYDESGNVPELANKLSLLNQAVNLLAPGGVALEGMEFQAGLYSTLQANLLISEILGGRNIDTIDGGHGTNALSDSEIEALIAENFDTASASAAPGDTAPASKGALLQGALSLVNSTKDVLLSEFSSDEENNDLGEDMDEFLQELGFGDGSLSSEDLAIYLKDNN